MNFSDNLKKIRKDHHLSQEQLADKLGVSRQSVSKWESALAYPEMDKLIQISSLFQVNLDDLLNSDIKEKNKERQSKSSMNKYIDSFFAFLTKTVKMFSNMGFKSKIKCLLEQFILIMIISVIFLFLGSIGQELISGFFGILPESIYYIISQLLLILYVIISFVIGIILILYIFKIRYLDYFEIIEEDINTKELNSIDSTKKIQMKSSSKKDRIIIRDPKDANYKFIKGLIKCMVVFWKIGLGFVVVGLCLSLICLIGSMIVSFLITKTGILFIGILLALGAGIIINIISLIILINFIINRKNNKKLMLYIFIVSLILCGIGCGFTLIGCTKFNYISEMDDEFYKQTEVIIPMQDNFIISDYDWLNSFEFVEENRKDLKIVLKQSKVSNSKIVQDSKYIYLDSSSDNIFEMIRKQIDYINHFQIVDYDQYGLKIYASKENIEKLKKNIDSVAKEENLLEDYQQQIIQLEEQVENLKSQLADSEEEE